MMGTKTVELENVSPVGKVSSSARSSSRDPTCVSDRNDLAQPSAAGVDVSIIVVSYNTRSLTIDCLTSIFAETRGIRFEVILIDNASSDGSADAVAAAFPEVVLVRNEENRGFAAANNQGIALARGPYLLLLNSDTRILDDAVTKAVAFADVHPEAGVVGCRTVFPDGRPQNNCYMFPSLLNLFLSLARLSRLFPRNRFFGRQRMTWWDYDTTREVDVVAGCFMLVRREALAQVGPMAEDYFMYSEETDWCWRFRHHGWKTLYTPEPLIVHLLEGSSSRSLATMRVLQRRSLLMFIEKKSGKLARRIANAMLLASALIQVAAVGLFMLVSRAKDAATARQWELSATALRFHLWGRVPQIASERTDTK